MKALLMESFVRVDDCVGETILGHKLDAVFCCGRVFGKVIVCKMKSS